MEVKVYKENKQSQEDYNAAKIYICHDLPHICIDSDIIYNVYILLDSCIRAQGSRKEHFSVENFTLHTIVRRQIHAGVKCLQNKYNNVTTEKSHDIDSHTLKNPSCEICSLTSALMFFITCY